MSFREKSAWISLLSILLVSIIYALHLPWSLVPPSHPFYFHVLLLCVALLILIEIVAHVVVVMQAPKDARTPKDERDRLIAFKAVRIAYYVFVVGAFLSVVSIHLGANQFAVGYGVLVAFVVAQMVNFAARIVYYRRGV